MRKTAFLVLPLLALISPDVHARRYNILTTQGPMYHAIGYPLTEVWRAHYVCGGCTGAFSTSGPYATDLGPGEAVVMTSIDVLPNAGSTLSFYWDIYDHPRGKYYFTKTYSTNIGWKRFDIAQAVELPISHTIEVRTRHKGNGYLDQSDVFILTEAENKIWDIWPVQDQGQYHRVGYPMEGRYWEARENSSECQNDACVNSFFTYGPYYTIADQFGQYAAVFHASTTLTGSASVATFDVTYIEDGAVKIAGSFAAKGSDFKGPGVMSAIVVPFIAYHPPPLQWEFRVRWSGKGTLRQDVTKIYRKF